MLGLEYGKRIRSCKFRRKISSKKRDLRKGRLPEIRLKRGDQQARRSAGHLHFTESLDDTRVIRTKIRIRHLNKPIRMFGCLRVPTWLPLPHLYATRYVPGGCDPRHHSNYGHGTKTGQYTPKCSPPFIVIPSYCC